MFLTAAQLADLTGRVRPRAQRRALERMGIRHHVRPDGRPVVATAALLDAQAPAPIGPDWSALGEHRGI